MSIRKHQNILAFLYYFMGYATAFACLFTSDEMFVKSFGGLLLVKFTWLISEQF